jgi:seryl-tRNA synthetase
MNEEKDLIEGEESESEESTLEAAPEDKSQGRTYTDDDLNRILAKERRQATTKYNALKSQFDALQQEMDKKREAEDAAVMEEVNRLRDELKITDHVAKLLDGRTPQEQLDWLKEASDNVVKKTIPPLPTERKEAPKKQPSLGTFI